MNTLGELKKSGYIPKTIKDELRDNLIQNLQNNVNVFEGIYGYEDTVIPEIERAILSKHNINLLGLRGQAKTRLARMMVNLLDEKVPVVAGSPLNDDPLHPISNYAIELIKEKGDDTPIEWLHRNDRYAEKLATPDVSVADLIGDIDPIKAANLKLSLADERVIHYGIIPRSNRQIFVLNELPDLQARIQVALFNMLQEGDVQIRGFKLRLPVDIQFVFTANPEDYTNRGSIVTPLKDRIGSQILTHYPSDISIAAHITKQEAKLSDSQKKKVHITDEARNLLEQISFEARKSEYVDSKSGVSARLSISAYENLISTAERRAIINHEHITNVRVIDFTGVIPAITGKVELVYEGEQEGAQIVAQHLLGQAIKSRFLEYFPSPEALKRKSEQNPYKSILDWFAKGGSVDLFFTSKEDEFSKLMQTIPGLIELVRKHTESKELRDTLFFAELILHGLAEFGKLTKTSLVKGYAFKDNFSSVFDLNNLGGSNN
jgi:magnesium chelatase subunit I